MTKIVGGRGRPLELLFCILALGLTLVMLVASAEAATKAKRQTPPGPRAAAGSAATCRGGNLFPCGDIYSGNDYLGTDPDPFIRLMIQRDLGAKYGGSP